MEGERYLPRPLLEGAKRESGKMVLLLGSQPLLYAKKIPLAGLSKMEDMIW